MRCSRTLKVLLNSKRILISKIIYSFFSKTYSFFLTVKEGVLESLRLPLAFRTMHTAWCYNLYILEIFKKKLKYNFSLELYPIFQILYIYLHSKKSFSSVRANSSKRCARYFKKRYNYEE